MSDEDPKPPLGYRNYSDDRPERRKNTGAFVLGMVPGVAMVIVYGCLNFRLHLYPTSSTQQNFQHVPIFGCAAVVSGVVGMAVLRGPRRRFMLAGFLLGIALSCIIEGICFFG